MMCVVYKERLNCIFGSVYVCVCVIVEVCGL